MDLGLQGKNAVVAGGSDGLGFAVAAALAAEGANVAIGARDEIKLAHSSAQLTAESSGRIRADPVDVTNLVAVQKWIASVAEDFGSIHIVVANAGGPKPGPPSAFDLDAFRQALELSMLSSIALVQTCVPHLRQAGWGRILFISSIAAKQPGPNGVLTNIARPGLLGYQRSLVQELGDCGITVNTLLPGAHRTARLQELSDLDPAAALGRLGRIPLGRLGEPVEFGAAATFLAGVHAGYITGAALPIDGGLTASLY